MGKRTVKLTFNAQNIGPHVALNSTLELPPLKIAVFANNGSGKTFLSRMFRMVDRPGIDAVNKALSIGTSSGNFSFKIEENGESLKELNILLCRDSEPVVSNSSGYLFHVFNSDFVKDNVEESGYQPDGGIEGYILGKSTIDLKKEKVELATIEKEHQTKCEVFKAAVAEAKFELIELQIHKNTTEYKFSDSDVYHDRLDYSDPKPFDELKQLNSKLNTMPDDLEDIHELSTSAQNGFLKEVIEVLETPYTKSSFSQEFKDRIDSDRVFISGGLKKLPDRKKDWTQCPFCKQELKQDAKTLIEHYEAFLENEEGKVKERISTFRTSLKQLRAELENDVILFNAIENQFKNIKQYFPSESATELNAFNDNSSILLSIDSLESLLVEKSIDINKPIISDRFQCHIDAISNHLDHCAQTAETCNRSILKLNGKKQNTKNEKLDLKKRLCKSRYQKLRDDLSGIITELKSLSEEKRKVQENIDAKESQVKVKKQVKFNEYLEYYLQRFFETKYSYDSEQSCLKLHKYNISKHATDVLSDGEKSIVAFCVYLAEMHKVVERETDYARLFFVIDDPISSMDFHYVYSVAQILRTLHENMNLKRTRFLIFTHNLEFMSVLIRNEIIKGSAILSNGELIKLSRELVMPYEEHLRDVYMVSESQNKPRHTTPNSIRHVLETINKFEAPSKSLKEYIEANNVLENNELIYSLMHDGSHGALRQQFAYTNDMIISGCKCVIKFIVSKYEGQIELISSSLNQSN